MDNFDKNLQDKLNEINERDFEFKPAAWERFQKHREKESDDRKSIFYLWLKRNSATAAIILLLLISNVFFAHQSVYTRYEIQKISKGFISLTKDFETYQLQNEMKQRNNIAAIENLKSKLNSSNQTIRTLKEKNQVISKALQGQLLKTQRQVDNYQNQKKSQIIVKDVFSNGNFISEIGIPALLKDESVRSRKIIDKIIKNDYINSANNGRETINEKLDYLEKHFLNLNIGGFAENFDFGRVPEIEILDKNTSLNDKLILLKEKVTPTNHQVGLNMNVGFIPVENGVQAVRDLQTGLNASTLFFNRLRLNVGVNFWSQSYNYKNIDDLSDDEMIVLMENLPTPVPVNTQDVINTIEGQVLGFSFPMTAHFLLGKKTAKWKPYVGFGVIGRYFNNYKFEYYFTDFSNVYNTYEVKYEEDIKAFDFSLLSSNLGFNYQVSERLELDVAFNFSKSNRVQLIGITNLEQFGGQLNLKYNF